MILREQVKELFNEKYGESLACTHHRVRLVLLRAATVKINSTKASIYSPSTWQLLQHRYCPAAPCYSLSPGMSLCLPLGRWDHDLLVDSSVLERGRSMAKCSTVAGSVQSDVSL